MKPVTLIAAAMAAGAALGAADAGSPIVRDAYAGLKALVRERLDGRPGAGVVLAGYEQAPEAWRSRLMVELERAGAGQDSGLVAAAEVVVRLVGAAGAPAGKYAVGVGGAQGVQVGDDNVQFTVFGNLTWAGAAAASSVSIGSGKADARAGMVLRAPTSGLPEHVRGRDELLACLEALARVPDGRVHVLAGLGGTGKSTVALRLVEEVTRLGWPAWWVPAVDAGTVTAKLLGLARDLGAPPAEVAEARNGGRDPAGLLWRFLNARSRWLLVFDNADDLAALAVYGSDAAGGAGWLRPSGAGLIIVTSREGDRRAWGRHAELHPVGWLDAASGAQVLADLAPGAGPPEDGAALSERLGGLPLALHHAGSQLASEFTAERTFREYTRALDERFSRVMGRGATNDRAVVTRTWELSLDGLAARGRPQARSLLRVLSCLAPAVVIPPGLLDLAVLGRTCADGEEGAADGLTALSSVGLVTASPGEAGTTPGVTVHPLVTQTSRLQIGAADLAGTGGTAVALLAAATARLRHDLPGDWPAWLQLAPHVQAAYGYLAGELTDADLSTLANAAESLAHAFAWAGSHPASRELAETALQQTARLGAGHPAVVRLRVRVARARMYLGEHAEAERLYRDVLPDATRVLGPGHISTLLTRSGLAWVLAAQGQNEQAEQMYRDLLPDMTRAHGSDHLDTLAVRSGLADLLADRGKYEEAEQALHDVLADMTRVHGPDHPDTLTVRSSLAGLLAARDQYEEAEQAFRDLLADRLRVFGPDHPDTLGSRSQLAGLLANRGRNEEAEQVLRDLLAEMTRVRGPDHPETLGTRSWLAGLLTARDQYEEAEQAFRDLLADRLRVLGPDHLDTLGVRSWLASVLTAQGRNEEAEEMYRDLLADRLRVLGPDHPDTLGSRSELAGLLANLGRNEEAEQVLRDLLADETRVYGPDHPETLGTRLWLGRLLADQRHYEQAEQAFLDLLADAMRAHGPDHPSTLDTRHQIARLLADRGQREQAEEMYRDLLADRLRIQGPDHPSTHITQHRLTETENQM